MSQIKSDNPTINTNSRNYLIEFWRFLSCIMVLGVHLSGKINSGLFHAGYLGVEFFFIISGYFTGHYYFKHLADKALTERLKVIPDYMLSRLKRLYPMYLAALFMMLIIRSLLGHLGLREMLSLAKNCFADFLLLQWTPLGNEVLISENWYVPAVFWGGVFFIVILAFSGKFGGYVLAPLISLSLYRYYFILIGKIDIIVSFHCILRGIAGLGLGVFLSFICRQIKNVPEKLSVFLLVFANLILTGIFIYSQFGRRSKWDFLIIGLYAVSVFILVLTNLPIKNEKIKSAFSFLGKCTYPIYIFQMPIIEIILAVFHVQA